jgi:hypothetical protein
MDHVVEVVAPDRVQAVAVDLHREDQARVVQVGLGNQCFDKAALFGLAAGRQGQLPQEGHGRLIEDGVGGVQPQAVQVEAGEPVFGIVQEVGSDLVAVRPVEVDRFTPGGAVMVREVGPEVPEVVPLRAEVVVDDIQEDREPTIVAGVNQPLQPVRSAVAGLDREGVDAVVAPIPLPRELGHGHDLKCCDAQVDQMVQLGDDAVEGPLRGEGADVELIDDVLGEGNGPEPMVCPGEALVIDQGRGAVDVLGLVVGDRIRPGGPAVQEEAVPGAMADGLDHDPKISPVQAGHRICARGGREDFQGDRIELGRPHRELKGILCHLVRADAHGFPP